MQLGALQAWPPGIGQPRVSAIGLTQQQQQQQQRHNPSTEAERLHASHHGATPTHWQAREATAVLPPEQLLRGSRLPSVKMQEMERVCTPGPQLALQTLHSP